MNFKLLIILGLALVQSSLINASHLKMTSYNQSPSAATSLKWAYHYESSELIPNFEEIFLDEVDCNLLPNLIHWVPSSIVFDRNLNFDWAIPEHGEVFLNRVNKLRSKCSNVRLVVDPQLVWNEVLASQISYEQIPRVVDSLVNFCSKYTLQGLVVTFSTNVVLDDAKTFNFFKQLSQAFKYNNLNLLGYFNLMDNYEYVRPLVFEFLDDILIQTIDFQVTDKLSHNMPTVGRPVLETFLKFGAQPEKLTIQTVIHGSSFKRTSSISPVLYDITAGSPAAAGKGSFLFSEGLIVDPVKGAVSASLLNQPNLCRIKQSSEWTKAIDPIQQSPFAYTDKYWVSYDDAESFKIKIDMYKKMKIGGLFIDGINADDFSNLCGQGAYLQTKNIKKILAH